MKIIGIQKGTNVMQNRKEKNNTKTGRESRQKNGLEHGMTHEEYQEYVKQVTPVNNVTVDVIRAFVTGGIICMMGQFISNWLTGTMSLEKQDAAAWTSIILVAESVILTGFNLYSKIVKWGGAGALVPITGFANSVASPAIESQTEGQVFGIGCSIFKIAGPVILYGVFSSWILGVIYWIWQMWM
jgi:stage V sporulation protein AC